MFVNKKWTTKLCAAFMAAALLMQGGVCVFAQGTRDRAEFVIQRNDEGIMPITYYIDGTRTSATALTGAIKYFASVSMIDTVYATVNVTVQYFNSEKGKWEYYDDRTYYNASTADWEFSDTMTCRYTGQYRAVGYYTAVKNGLQDIVEDVSNVIYVA